MGANSLPLAAVQVDPESAEIDAALARAYRRLLALADKAEREAVERVDRGDVGNVQGPHEQAAN